MFTAVLAIVIGVGLANQTAINSYLRKFVGSPFLASMISFVIGTIFLTAATLISGSSLTVPLHLFATEPYWLWLGGVCGVIALTSNILLFSKLGSVQTTVMPILGMSVMGMIIDNFGWFNSMKHSFGFNRIIGVVLVLIGVFLSVAVQSVRTNSNSKSEKEKKKFELLIWQIIGILVGFLMAIQSAINGQLGRVVHSTFHAAFISFFVGSSILIVVVGLKEHSYSNIKKPITQGAPWWIWIGGFIGALYILINVYLVGQIGTGQTVVLALFGQIAGSLLVQQFGLLNSVKNKIIPIQVVGLLIMLIGVVLIKIF
ncbi:membrane protein [Clostridium zeae]|uniref:Membrane protein n=1 Tax=Clostridium zeae TaxID=2759022 RepID=A0ABQ1E685_9CLOT|nr:DMT family transporter [Clostridium zeae]GFZ30251.1 membrane protein [Clostridium zeae]